MFNELEEKFKDECGVFGIYLNEPDSRTDAARSTFYGVYALQHRGQESAGIAVSNGHKIILHKNMGLVSEVINSEVVDELEGNIAIGHVRYSTTGESGPLNAQPLVFHYLKGMIALAHNGNLTNTVELRKRLATYGSVFQTTTDTEIVANLLARYPQDEIEDALAKCLVDMKGAFALVILTEDSLVGVRDQMGIRPLCIGILDGNYVLSSESAAFDTIGAEFIRDVEPGEIIVINKDGMKSIKTIDAPKTAHCVFEYIYFARPDSVIDKLNVYKARREVGKQLARQNNIDADLVISVPDSGTAAALGYAEGSGLPFQEGLMKNRYIGRTFIQPTQQMRELGVRLKLNPVYDVVEGKRIIMVDDSIVRGTTSKNLVNLLRKAGAKEVHMMVASPPTKYPCYYGVDTSRREELIANLMTNEEIAAHIGADSLNYIDLNGLFAALGNDENYFCAACFSGNYPIGTESIEEE
ncbi:Amidophosphoribosyltransferase [Candidatus Syntrophocurvum alkaliphilum]|uniref:Amidophosphoribosyltransferase n=1 Tax=Candidatus Syntrophocurvum alkaliphilum TaxID=2293317 RepID=A0A6I6DDY3_9FIRM|nr:amidophosphoribosyltransferase [Candidatus Syntrophocurvum alkaliphilum]QGT98808.1 Amidophosphoribosyltransferase [Candidatus Syntrophocurvum alkaliphilum]